MGAKVETEPKLDKDTVDKQVNKEPTGQKMEVQTETEPKLDEDTIVKPV